MMDTLSHMVWREALWLWLALCPWLLWILRGVLGRPRGHNYADPGLLPWARAGLAGGLQLRRFWRHGLLALAWLLFAMAMAGPRLAETVYEQEKAHYAELIVVLDVSRSMTARDVAPSRLQRAKLELEDLLTRGERLRIGLVVYAARPHLMTPPTHDRAVLRHYLQLLRPGLLPTEGSDLPQALEFAATHFSSRQTARALLVVSDGELAGQEAVAKNRFDETIAGLAQQGIVLSALGVATPEGAPLQGPRGGWLRHHDRPVISTLHEDRLRKLAEIGNGRYASASDTDADWQTLYEQHLRYLQATTVERTGDSLIEWREFYAWCLIPAIVLLLLASSDTRRVSPATSSGLWPGIFLATTLLQAPPAQAAPESVHRQAYLAYGEESWQVAKQAYARIDGYTGRMGEGSSAYRLEEYQQAIHLFTQAVLDADNDSERARAIFNLANSHYRLADYVAAAALYREVLRYAPDHPAAKLNLEFATSMQNRHSSDDGGVGLRGQGRGMRSRRFAEDTEVTKGDLKLDEEEEESAQPALPPPADRPPPLIDIIEQGIYQSRPAVEQGDRVEDRDWQYTSTSPERIVLEASQLEIDESILWQRLFETEEGFSSPLETPRELPEVPPW